MPGIDSFADEYRASRRRHLLGFGAIAGLAVLLAIMAFNFFRGAENARQAAAWQMHSLEVLLTAEQMRAGANEAIRGERGYLITGDARFLEPYREGVRALPDAARRLRQLTRDNRVQQAHLDRLETQVRVFRSGLASGIAAVTKGRATDQAVAQTELGRLQVEPVLATLRRIDAVEHRLLAARDAANREATEHNQRADVAVIGLAFLLLLAITWTGIVASRARMQALRTQEELRRAAETDELTGLLSRRAFLTVLDSALARARAAHEPVSLALIDLDYFKRVNDSFGHHGGDAVLRRFAEIAGETMRTADVLGRLGGEEFGVLMPATGEAEAAAAAERLRRAVAGQRTTLSDGTVALVTVSIGVAQHAGGESRDRLMVRADEALYAAKESGRNRTQMAA